MACPEDTDESSTDNVVTVNEIELVVKPHPSEPSQDSQIRYVLVLRFTNRTIEAIEFSKILHLGEYRGYNFRILSFQMLRAVLFIYIYEETVHPDHLVLYLFCLICWAPSFSMLTLTTFRLSLYSISNLILPCNGMPNCRLEYNTHTHYYLV